MKMTGDSPKTVDAYIDQFQGSTRSSLEIIRRTIKKAAPEAEEKMSWRMPTYAYMGNLVHFAAHSKHIGFYPGPGGIEAFKDRIRAYKWSKGAVQFPLDREMPLALVAEIVEFRMAQNKQKSEEKNQAKPAASNKAPGKSQG